MSINCRFLRKNRRLRQFLQGTIVLSIALPFDNVAQV